MAPRRWFSSRLVVPPAWDVEQRGELKAAVQELPSRAGIGLSNWNWKAVRRFVEDRFGLTLSRSSCLNYLHQLGFVLKRPRKRLAKANPARREAFVEESATLTVAARRTGVALTWMTRRPHRPSCADALTTASRACPVLDTGNSSSSCLNPRCRRTTTPLNAAYATCSSVGRSAGAPGPPRAPTPK